MRKIVVPVDFSSTSHNAYLYARGLAADLGATVEVVHIYQPISEFYHNKSDLEEQTGNLMDQLIDFTCLYPETSDVATMSKVNVGTRLLKVPVKEQIIQVSNEDETDLIVIGTTGSSNVPKQLLGGVAIQVAQNADCPVILVPAGAKYQSYQRLLFMTNYESATAPYIQQVIDFGNLFRAALHFVHVTESRESDYSAIENMLFNQLFKDGDPAFSFNMVTLNSPSVLDGLNQYIQENNIELAILVNRQRTILKNLLKQSLAKEMALYSSVPLMIYHH